MARIYLDHAATTPVRAEVRAAMEPYETGAFGNPSSIHFYGQQAKAALDNARDTIAESIDAEPAELTFTAGGTEADNFAIIGVMLANERRGKHLVISSVEHEAVLETAKFARRLGFDVTELPVDHYGQVSVDDVSEVLRDDTVLVSIMHANNEVGTIQPITAIAHCCRERGVLLHTDAVQSFGQLPVSVESTDVDLMSLSAHKIYGPKGVGALYVRRGVKIEPLMHGGGQERTRRSGTENVAGIAGFAEAVRVMLPERAANSVRMTGMRDWFIAKVLDSLPPAFLNGHPTERLPNNINLAFSGVEGEPLLLNLDIAGVAASSGSACTAGSIETSHVLRAMRVPDDRIRGALRLTIGRETTMEELEYTLDILRSSVERLIAMSHPMVSRH